MTGPDEPPMHDDDVIGGLRALGIPAEAIAPAMRRGDPEGAIFDAVLMPAIANRTVSASEIERRGGLRVSEVQAFISAFGLRPPGAEEPPFARLLPLADPLLVGVYRRWIEQASWTASSKGAGWSSWGDDQRMTSRRAEAEQDVVPGAVVA